MSGTIAVVQTRTMTMMVILAHVIISLGMLNKQLTLDSHVICVQKAKHLRLNKLMGKFHVQLSGLRGQAGIFG